MATGLLKSVWMQTYDGKLARIVVESRELLLRVEGEKDLRCEKGQGKQWYEAVVGRVLGNIPDPALKFANDYIAITLAVEAMLALAGIPS